MTTELINVESKATAWLREADVTLGGSRAGDPQILDARVFRRVALWGSLGLGESYMEQYWECERIDIFIDKILRHQIHEKFGTMIKVVTRLRDRCMNLQSVKRAFQVGEQHYDLGNSMYELLLGPSMGYSSGYFGAGAATLEEAQIAKFRLVCQKLGLQQGMKVLEIGAGWGAFAKIAAKEFGASVVGLTVSKEQLAYAEKKCAGLPVEFKLLDYRLLPDSYNGTFDRVVSIEMIEAVGVKNLRAYMNVAARALRPDGQFLVQVITNAVDDGSAPDPWIHKYIFPNGQLPTDRDLLQAVQGLLVLKHVESFGQDYDRTLMLWNERFDAHWNEIAALADEKGNKRYDERFRRMWRYYLLSCAGTFRSGQIDVQQIIFAKSGV